MEHGFLKGVGLGMMAGAAMGMTMAPKKRNDLKKTAKKAMKTMGQTMEDISENLGFQG